MQVFADGLVDEGGRYRGIYASRQRHHYLVVAQFGFQVGDGALHKLVGCPILGAAADVDHEIAQQVLAFGGVGHFGMELNSPNGFVFYFEGRHRDRRCGGDDLKI